MNCSIGALVVFHVVIVSIAGAAEEKPDTAQSASSIKIAPYYAQPLPGQLPRGYIQKGKTVSISEISVDTSGIPWFGIVQKSTLVWSPSKYWKYISEIDTAAFREGSQTDEEKKRRLLILRKHRDWPRRIIRAVRYGRICLDMTEEQLAASWGNPVQRSQSYAIGIGKLEIWLFKNKDNTHSAVLLKDKKIIGWTNK